jgi:hypothetical protein
MPIMGLEFAFCFTYSLPAALPHLELTTDLVSWLKIRSS